jgi:mono/diheme cytochrome c family protein
MKGERNGMGVLALTLVILLSAAGCSHPSRDAQADPLMDVFRNLAQEEGLDNQQTLGKQLFLHYCATCHGDQGEGDGQNAYNLDPVPPDFKATLKSHPSTYWRQVIENGTAALGRSPLCPPWGRELTSRQIDSLISYLGVLSTPKEEPGPESPDASQTQ